MDEAAKNAKNKKAAQGCLGGIVLLSVIAFIIFNESGEKKDPNAWKYEDNSVTAYVMAQQFVEKQLKSPSTAKFASGTYREYTTRLDSTKYRIVSYVDAQNSFGAMMRTKFVVEVKQVDADNWSLIDIKLLE